MRPADEAGAASLRDRARERPVGDVHRGLGDAVHVDQTRPLVAVALVPAARAGQLQRLAAEDHAAAGQAAPKIGELPVGLRQLVERRRRLVEHGDPLASQQARGSRAASGGRRGHDDQPAAVEQRAPQLPHREVEGVGVEQRPDVVGRRSRTRARVASNRRTTLPVRSPHALGRAGASPRCR